MPTDLLDGAARARLARRLDGFAADGVSGTVLLAEAGEPVAQHSLGLANRAENTPVGPDTRFQTASVTKMFTAVAVLDQVGQGRLTVRTPVVDVIPSDHRPTHLSAEVTVHDLLSHTSGIADYFEEDDSLPNYGEDYGALWHPSALQDRAPDRPPAAVRRTTRVSGARRDLSLLQRRLRPVG